MDCAEEVRQLEQSVGRLAGIVDLKFDIFKSRITVAFDPDVISKDDILAGIADAGMNAEPWSETASSEAAPWWRTHLQLLLTVLSAASLLTGLSLHVFSSGSLLSALGHGGTSVVPLASRALYTIAILSGLWLVVPKAWASLRRLRPDMNLLMTVAVSGAIALGEWFEAATVSCLFCLALLLEHWSMGRARRAISALMDLSPTTARCVDAAGNIAVVAVEELAPGRVIIVAPGEKIPLDGEVFTGESSVNEAPITGESMPVSKRQGDQVYAGTINVDGTLQCTVTHAAADSTLAGILHLVEEAQAARAPSQQWVERFAHYYTPAMMVFALALAVLPPLVAGVAWEPWIYRGLVVLVIACPCALVISTPVSIVSALTASSRQGVLIKGGRYLEACAALRAIAFDKTGTLTEGRPEVQTVLPVDGFTRDDVLALAAAVESHSSHPLAHAIREAAERADVSPPPIDEQRLLSGRGAEAVVHGELCWIGSHRLVHERADESPAVHDSALALADAGHSVVAVGRRRSVIGLIGVADAVREDAAAVIATLHRQRIDRVEMLTGDNEPTARSIAAQLGLDTFHAECFPEDKLRLVRNLEQEGVTVGMVGDGVNDAPALAAATVGVAMGAIGTDAAIETADVALMSDDLTRIPWLIAHARRTLAVVRQNIGFALGIKFVFVLLALVGLASLWMAIAADMGASLLVIFNGLRLLRSASV